MSVSDAMINQTTAAAFIPELWSDNVLEAVEFAQVWVNHVNRSYESKLKYGDILNIPNLSNLTTQDRTFTNPSISSDTIVFEEVAEDLETITVNKTQYAAFLIDGVVQVQQNQDIRGRYEKKIGYALARGVEVNLASLAAGFSTNVVGQLGVEWTLDDLLQAYQKLDETGIVDAGNDMGDSCWLVSPAAYVGLLKIDELINRNYKTDGAAMDRAKVGDLLSAGVYRSNFVTSNGAGHDNLLMHRNAIALIIQHTVALQSQYLIRNLADGVVGWRLYGSTRLAWPTETPAADAPAENRAVYLKGM